MFLGVLADDSVGREHGSQPRHALAHADDPTERNASVVARVEFRNDFSFEQAIKSFSFRRVPTGIIAMLAPIADGPADFRRIPFRPPAVQFGKVEAAIDEHFHAAGAAGFPGAARRIDPY